MTDNVHDRSTFDELPPMSERHDIPPHCKPTADGTACCVAALYGWCRKCKQPDVFRNARCSVTEERWTAVEWHHHWREIPSLKSRTWEFT